MTKDNETAIAAVLLFNGVLWGFAGFSVLRRAIEVGQRGQTVVGAGLLAVSCPALAYVAFRHLLLRQKAQRTHIAMAVITGLLVAGGLSGLLAKTTPRLARYGDAFWDKARQVCNGIGIPEAPAYTPTSGPHGIVAIGPDGEFAPTASIPDDWLPTSLEDTQVVLCLGPEQGTVLESCTYSGGVSIARIQDQRHFDLRAARTAEIIDSADFAGDLPGRCPRSTSRGAGSHEISGSKVSMSKQVVPWLRPYLGK